MAGSGNPRTRSSARICPSSVFLPLALMCLGGTKGVTDRQLDGPACQTIHPAPMYPGQSAHIRQVARRGQCQAQRFDAALGERLPRGAYRGLRVRAETPGRPDENVVQVPVAIEIERVDVRVFMRPSKRPPVPVAPGQFGRRRQAVPGRDADERAMQQFRLRQGPGHRRQRVVVAAGIREGEEHGVDAWGSDGSSRLRDAHRDCVGRPPIEDSPTAGGGGSSRVTATTSCPSAGSPSDRRDRVPRPWPACRATPLPVSFPPARPDRPGPLRDALPARSRKRTRCPVREGRSAPSRDRGCFPPVQGNSWSPAPEHRRPSLDLRPSSRSAPGS